MSVIVKGIKMPKDCPVCPLAHWNKLDNFTGCEVTKRYFSREDMETAGRPSFCPLVELPAQHGRLIDADVLTERLERGENSSLGQAHAYYRFANAWVKEAPTIIEAEEVSE